MASNSYRQHSRRQPHTILLVDDSPENLGVVFNFLDAQGFSVMVAQDGSSCLQKVGFRRPDLVLLDALMPGMDGFEVCRRLRDDDTTTDIPVIFMTGLTALEDKVRGFQAGAVDYVTKPVQEPELLARVETHLRIRDLTSRLQDSNSRLEEEIAARKRSEAALLDYKSRLEERVRLRTQELTQANQRLRTEMADRLKAEQEVNAQSRRLRDLSTRLADLEEAERRRLARELHDRVSQDLGILDINLNIVQAALPADIDQPIRTRLEESMRVIEQVAKHVYDVMADLRSPVLDDYGLVAALRWYCTHFSTRTGINVNVVGDDRAGRLPFKVESALFRIAQEGLTNVAKHAGADQVRVTVKRLDRGVRLTVTDNGNGFDPTLPATPDNGRGWGLMSMAERAEAIGGAFAIKTRLGQGTQMTVEAPL